MSHGPRTVLVGLVIALVALMARPACAFKEPGHRAIEAEAYRQLLTTEDGRKALETLIKNGVLNPPKRPFPSPSPRLYDDFADYVARGLVLETHQPDHLMDRQFEKDLQCFHWNARGSHVTRIDGQLWGVPRGLVVEAYVECLGFVDSVLRSVLFDPQGGNGDSVGMYALMHMVEDSYADSHVARRHATGTDRAAGRDDWRIIYLKPWNLRTWWSYFFATPSSSHDAPALHFSDRSHMMMESRDWGYIVGPSTDDDECAIPLDAEPKPHCTAPEHEAYRARTAVCLRDASAVIGEPTRLKDLKSEEIVLPRSCLTERALRAASAVKDLLLLVARHVERVEPERGKPGRGDSPLEIRKGDCPVVDGVKRCFAEDWEWYRQEYLGHVDPELTRRMSVPDPVCQVGSKEPPERDHEGKPVLGLCSPHLLEPDVRGNLVYPTPALVPRSPFTGGVGLSTELTPGTPLWLTFDAFVAHSGAFHNAIGAFDFLSYGIQLRIPLEDELGERPVGIAFDPGVVLPIPLSDFFGKDRSKIALYAGLHLRFAYTAKSVFEKNARHVVQYGLGGFSVDFVAGDLAWFGVDFPRYLREYDFWTRRHRSSVSWSVTGGIATNAF